jgi:predicted nucleic acid-binding protein
MSKFVQRFNRWANQSTTKKISNTAKTLMKIYLDVCCINRPFDDQTEEIIRMESEAVLAILKRCLLEWTLIGSEAIDYEISRIPDAERRSKVEQIASISREKTIVDESIVSRAREIEMQGLKPMDALHLACAERSADVMLTTDDEILRAAIRMSADIKVIVMNPARWLLDVL